MLLSEEEQICFSACLKVINNSIKMPGCLKQWTLALRAGISPDC